MTASPLDRYLHLQEFGDPLDTQEGTLSPTVRKQRARRNLGLASDSGGAVSRTFLQSVAAHSKLGGSGAGWVVDGDTALPLVTLPASQTAEVLLIPISGLPVGATLTGVGVNGQIESGGLAVTLALDVRLITGAAAGFADSSLATANVGSVVADTLLNSSVLGSLALSQVIAANHQPYVTLTATTLASTDIELYSLSITYTMPVE